MTLAAAQVVEKCPLYPDRECPVVVGTLSVAQVVEKASRQLAQLVPQPVTSIVSCTRADDGWRMVMEILERKAIPDTSDLLATYQVHLDDGGNLANFQRLRVRRRGQPVEE